MKVLQLLRRLDRRALTHMDKQHHISDAITAKQLPLSQCVTSPSGQPRFLDLFSGCGGVTLGMLRAGFKCLAAIDLDRHAVATLRKNLPEVEHVLEADLTTYDPAV